MRVRIALLGALSACVVMVAGSIAAVAEASTQGVVISEFRTRGPVGGSDEFVELYNATGADVPIGGWLVRGSNSAGTVGTRATIPAGTTLGAGCHYLLTNSSISGGPYSGAVAGDQTYSTGITDDGGVALTLPDGTMVVDQAGMSAGSTYKEGTTLSPLTTNVDRGYERKPGGAAGSGQDTDDNSADFALLAPSAPQNSGSTCIGGPTTLSVTDVSASEGDLGSTVFNFTVSLSSPAGAGGVTFDVTTADGTAGAPGDYAASSLTGQTIPEGSTAYGFSVAVSGDTVTEPDETFLVSVTNVTGAPVSDGQGVGTIVNDDVCGLPYTPIPQIQGSGSNAAITGNLTTQGVVVGDFEGTAGASGFYLQDATGDGDQATSDGIFVFTGNSNLVSSGQVVRVTGFARERFNQTTINGTNSNTSPVTNVVACGTASVAPTDVNLPLPSADAPERYEGMLTRFPQSLVISEYFNYDRFGEVVLGLPLDGETRPFTPTVLEEPGVSALARLTANQLRRITLDDAQSAQNPSVLRHPNGSPFSLTNHFRGGDTVRNAVGVIGFDFSLYRIFPTRPADYAATNPRPSAPEPVGGTLRVAAMNTLNFFVTADYPAGDPLDNKCGPAQNVECRGWDSDQPSEFQRQRDKLLAALVGLKADVVGLNELENTSGVEPLQSIVSGLPGHAYIETGTIGADAIKVGLIYKPANVTPIGDYKLLTSTVDPRFLDTKSRPVLAQTFEENATGARFTVAVNHLKSKGSDCNDVGDPDTGDGQGNCNATRTAAAKALVDWLATDPTGSGDPDFLIVGDLNSYAQEDPIDAIKAGPDDTAGTRDDYTNLVAKYIGPYAYSFVFDGMAGYLDHALSDASFTDQVTGVAEWHINADEPDVLDYDTSFKPPAQDAVYEPNASRTSDHDPILVGLDPRTTFDGLCRATRRSVTSSDVADSLCAQLEVAEQADERGNDKAKEKALSAYVKLISAQAGKSVTPEQAEFLARLVEEL